MGTESKKLPIIFMDRTESLRASGDGFLQADRASIPDAPCTVSSHASLAHSALVHAASLESQASLQKDILATWTGVDYSVYDSLDNVDSLWRTLIKELAILAELGKTGSGQKLVSLISGALASGLSYEDIAPDFNALIEYGDLWSNLEPSQRDEVGKREIQEEFGHFWRIMGIDSIFAKKTKKIVGELHDVISLAGNLERELGVIRERRISRKSAEPYLPVRKNIEPEGLVRVQSPHMVSTTRKSYPYVSAAMSSDSGHDDADVSGKAALAVFNKLLTRYPLEEAVALLDFVLYRSDLSREGLQFTTLQQYARSGRQYVKIISIGSQMIIHTRPAGNFSHTLMHVYRDENGTIGRPSPATYHKYEFEVRHGDVFHVLSSDGSKVLDGMTDSELTLLLNQTGSTGWIIPSNNIRRRIGGKDSVIMTQKCVDREEFTPPEFTDELIRSQLSSLIARMVNGKPLYVAVEGAHVHADRSVCATQAVGARIAGLLSGMLGTYDVEIFGAPMVDDDHVVNAFDYDHFSDFLVEQGYQFREIIFESSPLIYELSLDILKYLVASRPQSLKQVGDNLYLEFGDVTIELIEGLSGEFKTGCVLFDAALCLYKLYPDLLAEMYMRHVAGVMPESPFGLMPAHSLMLQIYRSTKRPEDRELAIKQHLPPRTVRLSDIHSARDARPFLDAVAGSIRADSVLKDQYIVTILEGTYNNQQKKLESLMRLLDLVDPERIVTVMFDQESGDVTFNR